MPNKFHKAESLIETLVAVFVLALSATAALGLMVSTMKTVDSVQDRVVAINLAREGLEAVRNVRESNWLEHSRERRDYWNCLGMSNCDNDKDLIQNNTNYIVDFDSDTFRWQLTEKPTALDLEDDTLASSNKDYLLFLEDFGDNGRFYTHNDNLGNAKESIFYRQITTRYLDTDEDVMEVKSRVEWHVDGNRVAHVELTTYLTDFLGRKVTIN